MKGEGGWRILTTQPLLVSSRPLETGGRGREMSEGEVGQQDENEKMVHRQDLLALFISSKDGLWRSQRHLGRTSRNKK